MRLLFAALIAGLLAAGPSHAQSATPQSRSDNRGPDRLGLTAIYRADIFRDSLAAVGRPELLTHAAPLPPEKLAALAFTPSSEVERATRQKLLASLLQTVDSKPVEEEVRLTIRSDDLWRQFDAVVSKAGLSSRNLADVTAATYLIAWQVLNSNSGAAGAQAIRAVRDGVAAAMLADGRVAAMSDAEKQQAASVMAYLTTVAADSANQLHSTGNDDALARLREHLHATFLAAGVDLDRLRLTEEGFVAR